MYDIHSHILPGVDDGSEDFEMTYRMLAMSYDSGVDGIVATPHCNIPDLFDNYADGEIEAIWRRFRNRLLDTDLPIRVYRGMEVFTTEAVPQMIREGRVWTINGTGYFLMEFDFDEDPDFCNHMIREILKTGVQPVIAHPERYHFIQKVPQLAYLWCTNGCALQVNKDSILGRFGPRPKETAEKILRHGLVAAVASDAHRVHVRTTDLAEVRRDLEERYGPEFANLVLVENPRRILEGRPLVGYRPVPFRERYEGGEDL